jgi:hypothetical protein
MHSNMAKSILIFGLLMAVMSAGAADMKIEAKLIWGSNDPADTIKHKLVQDPKLNADLHRIFKWSNYYEITNQTVLVAQNKSTVLQMSQKCKLDVKNLGSSRVSVNCIGNGKPVSKGEHSLAPGKWFTLAGNDKNNTAWFVVMRSVVDVAKTGK